MNQLKSDVLQAYEELGGINYLLSQPELLKRILVKLVKQPTEPPPVLVIDFAEAVPWLSPNRLAYKRQGEVVENVTDITPILDVKKAMSSPPEK